MRTAFFTFAACAALLCGCGGPQTSQANNAQANISNNSRDVNQATGSNMEARLSLGYAAKVMHARHEAMDTIAKNFKVLNRELNGSSPDRAALRPSPATINQLAPNAASWFPDVTGPHVGKT